MQTITTCTPPSVIFGKRLFDVVGAIAGLAITAPVLPLIALAIKLESPGPVLFRQRRVGAIHADRTELFDMIKFRSMRQDAEKASGPVWAGKRDPRITRVGAFLRKSRLDELPQLINVLKGEMSLIGPRPERPSFYPKLEKAIPYYGRRTEGVKPGVTGLAQVSQGYDETIEDVRTKVLYDHVYAATIHRFGAWIKMDGLIVVRTLAIMVLGRGR